METAKSIVILLILVMLTVGPSQSAEEPARRVSNTRTANCLVKITCDPAILPPDSRVISYLLHSSGVGGKAAREVLDLLTAETDSLFTIEYLQLPSSESLAARIRSPRRRFEGEDQAAELEYQMMMETEMEREEYGLFSAPQPKPSSPGARSLYGTTRTRRTAPTPARTPLPTSPSSVDEQTYLFGLNINLPEDVKPAAGEFLIALVENLRSALRKSYDAYIEELHSRLRLSEHNRDITETQLAETTSQVEAVKVTPPIRLIPEEAAVHQQLETIVDLSNLSQAMPFEEVVIELENAADPPLQIQPNWKDLLEFADIEPTTPALIDPLTGIKLSKALELLTSGLSSDLSEVGYVVDNGVVVIATENALPKKMVTHVYEISALAHLPAGGGGLVRGIQESIEPDSWFDLSVTGEGTINVSMGNKLAVYQTLDIHRKIYEFLQSVTVDMPARTPLQIPPEVLLGENRDLLREKRSIEMEIARLRARQLAIEMQIVEMQHDIVTEVQPPDPVVSQLQQLIEMHAEQLALMERQYEAGRLEGNELADVKEKLTRAQIDLNRRRQQATLSGRGAHAEKYNLELADLTIELAEEMAALKTIGEQLGQTDQQLTVATMIDPRASRIRMATRAFEMADERVNEVNARIVNLRPPTVSVLGGR